MTKKCNANEECDLPTLISNLIEKDEEDRIQRQEFRDKLSEMHETIQGNETIGYRGMLGVQQDTEKVLTQLKEDIIPLVYYMKDKQEKDDTKIENAVREVNVFKKTFSVVTILCGLVFGASKLFK